MGSILKKEKKIFTDTSSSSTVSQTITNGVTDKSPSEDAIFDALALKADKTDLVASKIFMYRNFK